MPQLIFLHQKWLGGAQNLIIWLKMCIHKLGWTFQTENHDDVDLHKLKLCKIQNILDGLQNQSLIVNQNGKHRFLREYQ